MALFLALSLTTNSVHGQNTALKQRPPDARRIVLDVIADSPLVPVSDVVLTQDGKRIAPDSIRILSAQDGSDAPPQVILVIDAINGNQQDVSRSEEAVEAVLQQTKGSLAQPTSIVIFSDVASTTPSAQGQENTAELHPRQLYAHRIPATTDGLALAKALNEYKLGLHRILESQAGPGQAERVRLSLQALSFLAKGETPLPGPKLVAWISPGWPFLAKSDARSSAQLFDSVVYFSDLLREARMIVYAINPQGVTPQNHSGENEGVLLSSQPGGLRASGHLPDIPIATGDDFYKSFLKSPRGASESNTNDLALQVLAFQSGGQVLQHNNDLRSLILQCVSYAGHIRSLSFVPFPGDGSTHFHAVQVRRSVASTPLRSRAGFYTR